MKIKSLFGDTIILLVILILSFGEVICAVKMIKSDWDPIGKREIIYTVSFFTGLGSIVGWFNIEDS